MKKFRMLFAIILLITFGHASYATEESSIEGKQTQAVSYYYTGFSHPDYYLADTDGSVMPFSWMPTYNLRTFHQITGYGALLSGLTAIGSGIAITRSSSSRFKSIHGISAAATAGFTITAFSSGVLSYASMLDFGDGMNTQTSHALLGTLASIGFMVSAAIAPEDGSGYGKHAATAEVSGAMMLSAVIVIQF
jgi:hypothetical protein